MPSSTRREFLSTSLGAACALALPRPSASPRPGSRPGKPLRLLVLGGTGFLGPHLVTYALGRGHTVTLFNRGRTNTHLFPDLEKLQGDRAGDLDALKGRDWDAVLDDSGYVPSHVKASAELLQDHVGRYLFTSSRQVFSDVTQGPPKSEDAPLLEVRGDEPDGYGERKVLCERYVTAILGPRATIVRPTAVAGPRDRTDRFTYWPVRIDRGGEVLAPGTGKDPIQYIDVRDLTEFMVHLCEQNIGGPFNAVGPAADLSAAELLHGIRAITGAAVSFTWVDAEFLAAHRVRPRQEMPLWTPARPGATGSPVSPKKAIAHGLRHRPLAVTAKDTLDWHLGRPAGEQGLSKGLSPEREALVLAAWHARERK